MMLTGAVHHGVYGPKLAAVRQHRPAARRELHHLGAPGNACCRDNMGVSTALIRSEQLNHILDTGLNAGGQGFRPLVPT